MTTNTKPDLIKTLQGLSDRAYCDYITKMRSDACLGWEAKVQTQRFGKAEIEAHTKAGELLGRHKAFSEAANKAALSAAAQPTAGFVLVPTELAERVQETMGEFLMDHVWRQQDMDTSDEFGALLAVATKAAPAPAVEVGGPLNELEELNLLNKLTELGARAANAHAAWNSDDGHKGTAAYVQWQELRSQMGDLIRAAYAAPTTQAAPQREVFDEDGFRAWVIRNLPDNTIIGNSTWWAGHLAVWVQRFMSAAPRPAPASQDAEDAARYRYLQSIAVQTADPLGPIFSITIRRIDQDGVWGNVSATIDAHIAAKQEHKP